MSKEQEKACVFIFMHCPSGHFPALPNLINTDLGRGALTCKPCSPDVQLPVCQPAYCCATSFQEGYTLPPLDMSAVLEALQPHSGHSIRHTVPLKVVDAGDTSVTYGEVYVRQVICVCLFVCSLHACVCMSV